MKEKLSEDEIKARLQVVCICKGIKMGRICDAIKSGCDTVQAVNKATGSGSGGCSATRCGPVITELVKLGGKPLPKPSLEQNEDDDFDFP